MHKTITLEMSKRKTDKDFECLKDVVNMSLDKFKEEDPEFYKYLESLLYETLYGKVISSDMAHNWTKCMLPYHEHWTKEQTDEILKAHGINATPLDFYVVLNMMYNDYRDVLGVEDIDIYIKLAKGWLEDSDAKDCKLYNYHKYIIK